MQYTVSIEIEGKAVEVGKIIDGQFSYCKEYILTNPDASISIALPITSETYSPSSTKNFFDGLLPEGFTRKSVAQFLRVSEDDYLSILAGLGRECIGAIQISDGANSPKAEYKKLSLEEVDALAKEGATKSADIVTKSHLSLAGATGKVGLYYDEKSKEWYQPIGTAPSTHIIKQSHVRLDDIVVNELLCTRTAEKCGIEVPECFIVRTSSNNFLFATKRYDRIFTNKINIINGLAVPYRLHQEDFAQAMAISSFDKYEKNGNNYLKKMGDVLQQHSLNPTEDKLRLWDSLVFNYLIGNTDNHLKNYSLLYTTNLKGKRLSPAYDILSTSVYESSTRNLSMHIGNAYILDEVSKESFELAASEIGLGQKIAAEHVEIMYNKFEAAVKTSTEELLEEGFVTAKTLADKILKTGGYK